MGKVIISAMICILLCAPSVFAKNNDVGKKPEIQFMGIKWGDSVEIATKKLFSYGFTGGEFSDNTYFFEGNMFDCRADILIFPLKNKVHTIDIAMSSDREGLALFHDMVEKINKKYGAPSKEVREYEYPYSISVGDIYKGISEDKISFFNIYVDTNGNCILLALTDENEVLLSYKSKTGILEEKRLEKIEKSKQKSQDDIL